MKSEPCVIVTCDTCGYEEVYLMTALVGSYWDQRHVNAELREDGWLTNDKSHLCKDCRDGKEEETNA